MAKKIRGMYTFLEVVKGNLGRDRDPKLSTTEIDEILQIVLSRRQFQLYEKVVGYVYCREINEAEGDKIYELIKGHNFKPGFSRKMLRRFPLSEKWLHYFILNCLKCHQPADIQNEAIWLASNPVAPEKIQRLAVNFLIGRGRLSEAKVFKMKLGEEFTKEERATMYRYIMKSDMVYELRELFDLPGTVSISMLKSFVHKYSVDDDALLD